jgi:hypothetical protein
MPRPSIDESLAEEIRRIHRETQGETAGSFQEALDTVVQLALQQAGMEERTKNDSQGWYPGKYAGKVINRVIESANAQRSPRVASQESANAFNASPDATAVFKARLGEDRTVEVPEAEVAALGFDQGDILQFYAYKQVSEKNEQNDE